MILQIKLLKLLLLYLIMHQFTPVNYFKAEIEKWDKLGLQLLFLPPYSPELNEIEILWKHMKYNYLNQKLIYHLIIYISMLKIYWMILGVTMT